MTTRAISPPQIDWTRLPSVSDTDVLMAICQRKPAALGQLYDRYGRLVFVFALRITGDRPTAEVVTETVFQHIWIEAAYIPCECGSCAAWVLGVTRRCALTAAHHHDSGTRT